MVITDIYQHPVVQGLRRDRDALQRRNDHLEELLRVSLTRDLQTRALEPLRPLTPGPFAPLLGGLLTIHVDALRIRANRLHRTRDPLIRVINGDDVWHCREIAIGRARMAEDYDKPLPGTPSAVCVLQTADPIEVVR